MSNAITVTYVTVNDEHRTRTGTFVEYEHMGQILLWMHDTKRLEEFSTEQVQTQHSIHLYGSGL